MGHRASHVVIEGGQVRHDYSRWDALVIPHLVFFGPDLLRGYVAGPAVIETGLGAPQNRGLPESNVTTTRDFGPQKTSQRIPSQSIEMICLAHLDGINRYMGFRG